MCPVTRRTRIFQSTSPVWRTTIATKTELSVKGISIHVPRVEDDAATCALCQCLTVFQSTSPVWRTTDIPAAAKENLFISIHVPRVEDDTEPPHDGGDTE